ncbi:MULTISPECIES: hypothetical protein [Methanosarcina]|nr:MULTISPECIES: hypothetical protein [Methanosarcina]
MDKVPAALEVFLDKIEVRQEFFSIRPLDLYPADFQLIKNMEFIY